MLIHHITRAQMPGLFQVFAYLTKDGWVIPQWLIDLENTCQK